MECNACFPHGALLPLLNSLSVSSTCMLANCLTEGLLESKASLMFSFHLGGSAWCIVH